MRSLKPSKRAALLASIAATALVVVAAPSVSNAAPPKSTTGIVRPAPEDPTPPPCYSFIPGIRW